MNVTYTNYADFKAADRRIRKAISHVSGYYVGHVIKALDLFHTPVVGNHQIAIINDLLDTATAGRLQRNKIIEWLEPVVGHEVVKEEGSSKNKFGAKVEGFDYDSIDFVTHFATYPDWYAFKKSKPAENITSEVLSDDLEKWLKAGERLARKFAENYAVNGAREIRERMVGMNGISTEIMGTTPESQPENAEALVS